MITRRYASPKHGPDCRSVSDTSGVAVTNEVIAFLSEREPIFHGPAWPRTRPGLEILVANDFWEVGASGAVYSREDVLGSVPRLADPMNDSWRVLDLDYRELAPNTIAVTYILHQGERVTRRLTIWQERNGQWQVAYHQGTVVAG